VKWLTLMLWLGLVSFGEGTLLAQARQPQCQPQDAVVKITSHGGSGVIVSTQQGATIILSAAHMFERPEDKIKPIQVDVPASTAQGPLKVGVSLLAVDYEADLSLIRLNTGPIPYVCPVAPAGSKITKAWSAGWDEMRNMPVMLRPAHVLGSRGAITFTQERPNHGRSGGALIGASLDSQGIEHSWLFGIVQGYDGPPRPQTGELYPGGKGMYASHDAILKFMTENRWGMAAPPTNNFSVPQPLPYRGDPFSPYNGPQWNKPPQVQRPPPSPCPGGS
jgi:hypothetical protein